MQRPAFSAALSDQASWVSKEDDLDTDDKSRKRYHVVVTVVLWVICCNLFNASSKLVSSKNPWTAFATTTTQLGGTSLIGLTVMRFKRCNFSGFLQPLRRAAPIGLSLAIANGSMMWALSRTSIGMFQTVKASSPLFTAFACHVILGRRYTINTYLTLLPIMIGLAMASATDLEADFLGISACMLSSICQVFVNLSAKQLLEKTFPDLDLDSLGSGKSRFLLPFELQSLVSVVGFLACFCGLMLAMLFSLIDQIGDDSKKLVAMDFTFDHLFPPLHLLFWNVILYSLENVLAYAANGQLSRLPFAVIDALRRLSIVISFNVIFTDRTPTELNMIGIFGVAAGAIAFAYFVEER